MISTIMSYGSAEFTYTVNVDPAPATKAPDADNTAAASSDQAPAVSSDPSNLSGNGGNIRGPRSGHRHRNACNRTGTDGAGD